jgi:hypothetical protein
LGVTNAAPWFVPMFGSVTICFVSKSRRSITAIRGFALSLMKRNRPS